MNSNISLNTLLTNLAKKSLNDNVNYELEYALKFTEVNEFSKFVEILFKECELESFADEFITTYTPIVPIKHVFFRHFKNVNDGSEIFEKKECIQQIYLGQVKTKVGLNKLFAKYSIETTLPSIIEILKSAKVDNFQHRGRLTFIKKDFPFKIDVSVRYLGLEDVTIETTEERLRGFTLDETDVFKPKIFKGLDMKFDVEFEALDSYSNHAIDDFNKALEFITGFDTQSFEHLKQKIDITQTPQVGILTNEIIKKVPKDAFVWLDKTDGIRNLIACIDKKMFIYTSVGGLELLKDVDFDDIFIADSENFEEKFLIFDVYYVNKDIRQLEFVDRMEEGRKFLKSHKLENVEVKTFNEIDNWDKLIKYATTRRKGTDGVVLQLKEAYEDPWTKGYYSYKLKPKELITTDFLVKKLPGIKTYQLYLTGKAFDIVANLKKAPRVDPYSQEFFGYESHNLDFHQVYNILFASPLFEGMQFYSPVKGDMKIEDGKIYEMSPVMGVSKTNSPEFIRWKPIRCREDKLRPNGYATGISNVGILFSPPTAPGNDYFAYTNEQSVSCFSENLISAFHFISQCIRTYIFDLLRYKNLIQKKDHLQAIDIAGGRGGDLPHLFALGVSNLFAIDADAEALVKYSNKIKTVKQKFVNHILTYDINTKGSILFNAINASLGVDNSAIMEELLKRNEFIHASTDLIIINFAIHYICGKNRSKNFKALSKLCKKCLNKDGLIIISYYDGDEILEHNGKFESFDIKITKKKNYTEAMMPLPTISRQGYQSEPLVLSEEFEEFTNEFDKVIEFNPMNAEILQNTVINGEYLDGKLDDYFRCIKTVVLKLKEK